MGKSLTFSHKKYLVEFIYICKAHMFSLNHMKPRVNTNHCFSKKTIKFLNIIPCIIFAQFLFCACASEQEQVAINKISKLYQATVSTKIGYIQTNISNENSGKYFQIIVRNPAFINSNNHDDLHFPASLTAYQIFNTFEKNADYDFIKVVFEINGVKNSFEYSISQLKLYINEYNKSNSLMALILTKKFDHKLFDQKIIKQSDAKYIHSMLNDYRFTNLELIGFKEGEIYARRALSVKYLAQSKGKFYKITINTHLGNENKYIVGFSLDEA